MLFGRRGFRSVSIPPTPFDVEPQCWWIPASDNFFLHFITLYSILFVFSSLLSVGCCLCDLNPLVIRLGLPVCLALFNIITLLQKVTFRLPDDSFSPCSLSGIISILRRFVLFLYIFFLIFLHLSSVIISAKEGLIVAAGDIYL